MLVSRVGAIVVVGLALFAAPAAAAPNGGPGTAPVMPLGAPFSATWAGTPLTHPVTFGGIDFPTEWWRVAPLVRTGDQLQIGVDNSRDEVDVAVCLVSPSDEFGADSALRGCQTRARVIPRGRLDRIVIPHVGSTGQPLLVFYGGRANQGGGYSAVIEKVFRVVTIGTVNPLGRVKRKFTYRAFVRYGDGARADDGTLGFLQWRRSGRNAGPESFTTLARARSVKGRLSFKARLPKTTKNRVELRSCVLHPRGGTRCAVPERVRLRK